MGTLSFNSIILVNLLTCVNAAFLFHISPASNAQRKVKDKSSTLQAAQWPFLQKSVAAPFEGCENCLDPNYPWCFEGRFVFRPSLVRVLRDDQSNLPPCSKLLSLFGYTLGGSVVLEYDVSPVGPYREYVIMGGLVALGRVGIGESLDGTGQMRSLCIGQWGTNLYVSTRVAEDVCKEVWGVPAVVAGINFEEDGKVLCDGPDEIISKARKFNLSAWGNTRILVDDSDSGSIKRYGNIPIYWTPTIKALWGPISFPLKGSKSECKQALPVHKLRLSASAVRLKRCKRVNHEPSPDEIPLGLALVVDNVLIEISRRVMSGNLSMFG